MLRVEITKQFSNLAEAMDFLEIHENHTAVGELIFKEKNRELKLFGFPLNETNAVNKLAKALHLPPYSAKPTEIWLSISLSEKHILDQVEQTKKQEDFLNEQKEEEALRNERQELENWLKEFADKKDKEIGKGKGVPYVRAKLGEEGLKLGKVNAIEILREAKKVLELDKGLL